MTPTESKPDIRIAFLQRGIVLVGRYCRDGDYCYLRGGAVIRRWGTTEGIGEIAKGGPTERTILDPLPEIEWHVLTGVMTIRCDPDQWAAHVA